jgi:hypothetical protein
MYIFIYIYIYIYIFIYIYPYTYTCRFLEVFSGVGCVIMESKVDKDGNDLCMINTQN